MLNAHWDLVKQKQRRTGRDCQGRLIKEVMMPKPSLSLREGRQAGEEHSRPRAQSDQRTDPGGTALSLRLAHRQLQRAGWARAAKQGLCVPSCLFCVSMFYLAFFFFPVRNEDGRILSGRVTQSGVCFLRSCHPRGSVKGGLENGGFWGQADQLKSQRLKQLQGRWVGEKGTG